MFNDCKQIMTVREMDNRKNWLSVRAQGIGGSDAGAIMGLNKYKGPMAVYLEKTGLVEPEDISKKPAVIAGQMLEPVVARMFEEETGKKVRRMGTLQSLERSWMHANPDRVIIGENAGLEIKTGGAWSKGLWADDNIPDSYYTSSPGRLTAGMTKSTNSSKKRRSSGIGCRTTSHRKLTAVFPAGRG